MKADTIDYLKAGLKVSGLRQSVIANNIANVQTPQFKRGVVAFEQALDSAIKSGDSEAVGDVAAEVSHPGGPIGDSGVNDVSLDTEIGELIKNTTVSKTYLRLLGKLMRQMEMAVGS